MTTPGRSCPLHYRYAPVDLARTGDIDANCIYVAGGLYGNVPALDAIDALAAAESTPPLIVFNGDFNWFNVDDSGFEALNRRVLGHCALRGNVETELATDDPAAGCGCGYPEFVNDADVERSNRIMERLRQTSVSHPATRRKLGALPMFRTAIVGAVRIAIVHGDCESLAGWGLSQEALTEPDQQIRVENWFHAARVDVIASSHSCLPIMMDFATHHGIGIAVNNGAAGLPNFEGTQHGVITRIGVAPSPPQPLYGTRIGDVHIDALAVHYDEERWKSDFDRNWPVGSPAHLSYAQRIAQGPHYRLQDACRLRDARAAACAPVAA